MAIMMANHKKNENGFTLFLAIIAVSTLLLIVISVSNFAVRQSLTSSFIKESQIAFYAADSGLDCALYWDVKNPGHPDSAFVIETQGTLKCASDNNNFPSGGVVVDGATRVISLNDPLTGYCAEFTIKKETDNNPPSPYSAPAVKTIIESRGYNTCDTSNPRRVERAVQDTNWR